MTTSHEPGSQMIVARQVLLGNHLKADAVRMDREAPELHRVGPAEASHLRARV